MTKLSTAKTPKFVKALLTSAYLPDEVPGIVSSEKFASYCEANYSTLIGNVEALKKLDTTCDQFSAPRNVMGRRVLSIVNPGAQFLVASTIAESRNDIRGAIKKSGFSLYRVKSHLSKSKAFLGLDFRRRDALDHSILARSPVILRADIAAFFHTIYTHSLPWAMLGKENVKALRRDRRLNEIKGHWSDKLDVAIRVSQAGETFGIPVGPDTSRIIAEVLLSGIHDDPELKAALDGRPGYRLVDDFFIGFQTEDAARHALGSLRRALWKFNLHLNDSKTSITRSSDLYESPWKIELSSATIPTESVAQQKAAIARLIDIAIRYCAEIRDGAPAVWVCSRLSKFAINRKNLHFVRDVMLRFGRDFPNCLPFVLQFLGANKEAFSSTKDKKIVREWSYQMISTHLSQGHDFELAYSLMILGVLGIKLESADRLGDFNQRSSVCRCILGLLSELKLLEEPLEKYLQLSNFVADDANNRNWLLLYEAVHRGWINHSEARGIIKSHPFLNGLLTNHISFLDETIFVRARPSKPAKSTKKQTAEPFVDREFNKALRRVRRSWNSYGS